METCVVVESPEEEVVEPLGEVKLEEPRTVGEETNKSGLHCKLISATVKTVYYALACITSCCQATGVHHDGADQLNLLHASSDQLTQALLRLLIRSDHHLHSCCNVTSSTTSTTSTPSSIITSVV